MKYVLHYLFANDINSLQTENLLHGKSDLKEIF